MCSYIVEKARLAGTAKVPNSRWMKIDTANVYYDHPYEAQLDHALCVDFVCNADGGRERVAIEISRESALDLIETDPSIVNQLRENTAYFRREIVAAGFHILEGNHPIVPIMLGEAALAQEMSRELLDEGEQLNPIQPKATGQRGRAKQSAATNLLRRMRQFKPQVLRYLHEPDVPFTNNEAERAIRMPKVKQKVSGCFRAETGAQSYCTIRSYLDTMRKQAHDIFTVLAQLFRGDPVPVATG